MAKRTRCWREGANVSQACHLRAVGGLLSLSPCLSESLFPKCGVRLWQQTVFCTLAYPFVGLRTLCPWSTVSLFKWASLSRQQDYGPLALGCCLCNSARHDSDVLWTWIEFRETALLLWRNTVEPLGSQLVEKTRATVTAVPLILRAHLQPCWEDFWRWFVIHRNYGWRLKKRTGFMLRLNCSLERSSRWVPRPFLSSEVFVSHL